MDPIPNVMIPEQIASELIIPGVVAPSSRECHYVISLTFTSSCLRVEMHFLSTVRSGKLYLRITTWPRLNNSRPNQKMNIYVFMFILMLSIASLCPMFIDFSCAFIITWCSLFYHHAPPPVHPGPAMPSHRGKVQSRLHSHRQ